MSCGLGHVNTWADTHAKYAREQANRMSCIHLIKWYGGAQKAVGGLHTHEARTTHIPHLYNVDSRYTGPLHYRAHTQARTPESRVA